MRKVFCFVSLLTVSLFAFGRYAAAEEPASPRATFGGLTADVEVVVDRYGFPHIYARNEADAMFALGYMHAKDRLWQMDFNRRASEGRLAEIFGPDAIYQDIFIRTVGLNRLAKKSDEMLRDNSRLYLNLAAYSWGVNSYVAQVMPENLPLEFRKLDYIPEPWTPADSLAIGKAMAWELCGSLDDLYLGTLVEKLGLPTVEELFPIDRYKEVPIIPEEYGVKGAEEEESRITPPAGTTEASLRILKMASDQARILGNYNAFGSNNWVIDGEKSATGKPILASDPHLGFQMPCVWYAVHIKGGNLDIEGVSLPGVPVISIGRNRRIAWGITSTQADVTDFYGEVLNKEKTRYLYKGDWKPLEIFSETIKVRGQEPRELRIPATLHGPILSTPQANLAIQWTGAVLEDDALAFYLLGHAVDYDDFAAAMQTLNSAPMNFAYADSNGMIAMWVAGLFPMRKEGLGRIPVDGSTGQYDWTGFVPRIDTPHCMSPSQHYLASANQRPANADYPYYLGYEWDPGYRARRINQLLSSHEGITFEQMKGFQADTHDVAAESMLPHLVAACKGAFEEGTLHAQALDALSNWDFTTKVDGTAPTIWWAWLDKFRDDVWQDEWKTAGIDLKNESWGHTDLNKWQPPLEVLEKLVVEQLDSKWFDDVTTPERETLKEIAARSLRKAVDELSSHYGDKISEWKWGRANLLHIKHLSGEDSLGRGRQPLSGSELTLNARGHGGDVTGGPSWRMVVDFSDTDNGMVCIFAGGQSGDPQSPHYDDLLDKWVKDEYVPLLFYPSPDQFSDEQVESRIKLFAPTSEGNLLKP